MKYAVVIEKTESGGYSAYVPDLPGFGVAAPTLAGVRELVAEGVPFQLEGLALNGLGVPKSKTMTDYPPQPQRRAEGKQFQEGEKRRERPRKTL